MTEQLPRQDEPTIEDMLCTLYTTIQGVGKKVDVVTELVKQQAAIINILITDLTNLRAQITGRPPTAPASTVQAPVAPPQTGRFPWDQRKDEGAPEDVFKGMGQRIPNR
jgi:hypothetical protein